MAFASIDSKLMSVAKAFLDTNVLLYLLSSDSAKADRAEWLITAGTAINVQVLNEFAAVATRKARMPIADVRIILTTIRRTCFVSDLDVETHELGLTIAERYRFSLYDALIVAAALRLDCETLYTEDLQNGQRIDGLRIENPF